VQETLAGHSSTDNTSSQRPCSFCLLSSLFGTLTDVLDWMMYCSCLEGDSTKCTAPSTYLCLLCMKSSASFRLLKPMTCNQWQMTGLSATASHSCRMSHDRLCICFWISCLPQRQQLSADCWQGCMHTTGLQQRSVLSCVSSNVLMPHPLSWYWWIVVLPHRLHNALHTDRAHSLSSASGLVSRYTVST